jgi:hypothetical protein
MASAGRQRTMAHTTGPKISSRRCVRGCERHEDGGRQEVLLARERLTEGGGIAAPQPVGSATMVSSRTASSMKSALHWFHGSAVQSGGGGDAFVFSRRGGGRWITSFFPAGDDGGASEGGLLMVKNLAALGDAEELHQAIQAEVVLLSSLPGGPGRVVKVSESPRTKRWRSGTVMGW